ncbi:FecR domain-containing protein [Methylococcus sp. EFPC2]|uniref:FecR family protein n=1 Tax=Methylococcus sp. EFPC2 TaxID=2812648 RepID=UPI00196799AB|nr:FecR domain-containing protein [Methylococcus sp. EFPC2]QSA96012.1 FecR domain-containing protein [Methylococcus sp. EFPC2]
MTPSSSHRLARRQALAWLTRLHSGHVGPQERAAFQRWLAEDEAHWREYGRARKLWNGLGELATGAGNELAEARAFHACSRPWARALAAGISFLSLTLMAGGAIWGNAHTERLQTAWGERRHLELADGSSVELNGDTDLRVVWLADRRLFHLIRGEAVFRVRHGDPRSFDVYAGAGRVRDIGTAFAVQRRNDRIDVLVQEGAVEVGSGRETPRRLLADQRLTLADSGALSPVAAIDAADALAWMQGKLVFRNLSLGDVLAQICRYHRVEFTFADPRLADRKVSGVFRIESLPSLLSSLETALSLKVEADGARYLLKSR